MGKRKAEHGPNAFALEGPSNIEVNWSEIPVNPTPATTLSGPMVQVTQEGVPGRHVTTEWPHQPTVLATSTLQGSQLDRSPWLPYRWARRKSRCLNFSRTYYRLQGTSCGKLRGYLRPVLHPGIRWRVASSTSGGQPDGLRIIQTAASRC